MLGVRVSSGILGVRVDPAETYEGEKILFGVWSSFFHDNPLVRNAGDIFFQ